MKILQKIRIAFRVARLIQPGTEVLSHYGVCRVLGIVRDEKHPNIPLSATLGLGDVRVSVPLKELKKVHPRIDALRIFIGVLTGNCVRYDIPRAIKERT